VPNCQLVQLTTLVAIHQLHLSYYLHVDVRRVLQYYVIALQNVSIVEYVFKERCCVSLMVSNFQSIF